MMGMGSTRKRFVIIVGLALTTLVVLACSSPGLLQVTKSGPGSGTVKSVPAAIDCGPRCAAGSDRHIVINLGATPDPGMTFEGWDGDCQDDKPCSVDLNEKKKVTARFGVYYTPTPTETPWWTGLGTVTVTVTPPAQGTPGSTTPTPIASPAISATPPALTPTVTPRP